MVPSLESLPICTPRLFPRHMTCSASIIHHQIARVFLVTASTWVSIREDLGTRLIHPFLVPMTSFKGMSFATTLIVTFTTLVNFLYLISGGPSQSLHFSYYFYCTTPVHKYLINPNWILLNSCSTVSSFINPSLLSYINYFHTDTAIFSFTNCGYLDYKQSDTLNLLTLIFFYNLDSISKILALVGVTSQFRVTMDTNN